MDNDKLVAEELVRCNKCGYCQSACPTYRVDLTEARVARGRLALVEALQAGEIADLPALREPLFDCLLCGACTEACYSAVKTDEVMVRARHRFHRGHGQPAVQRSLFRLLRRPGLLTVMMRLMGLAKRTGLSGFFRRLGLLRWINATLEGAEGLVETMPRRFLRDRLRRLGFQRQGRGTREQWVLEPSPQAVGRGPRVLYFIGCGTNYQTPAAGEAALRLLSLAGCELVVLPNVCCGLPPYSYGDLAAARGLAGRNLQILPRARAEYVVSECGSCSRFLKQYRELLEDDPRAAAAVDLSERVRDFTELLAGLELPAPVSPLGERITYHDPCHLGRGQGLREAPRELLRQVAPESYVELPEADWCCGGAGSYNLTHPELSLRILNRKLSHLRTTGATTLATACPSCLIQIGYGVRRAALPVQVRHLAEVLAEAHGLPALD